MFKKIYKLGEMSLMKKYKESEYIKVSLETTISSSV